MRSHTLLAVSLALFLPTFMLAQDRAALDETFLQANRLESSDPARATRLYDQAAGQGHTLSMVMLGYRLIYGTGEPQDLPRAFSLFTAATKAGSLDGQFLLAMCYLEGLGTAKNPTAARDNLLEPADKGNQFAQFTLGIMMQNGEGGPKREAAARRWLDRAAGGPDAKLAARAATFRDQLDSKLFASNNSTGQALTALLFVALLGVAMGGANGGDGGGVPVTSPSGGMGMGSGGGGSAPTPPPARPTPHYPNNPTKTVMGDLTDSRLQWY
jgi:TPR repeat protein